MREKRGRITQFCGTIIEKFNIVEFSDLFPVLGTVTLTST
jgi:hypothetical protein